MSVNQKDEFWDRIEIKDTIQISEKDRITINIAEKNSKRFLNIRLAAPEAGTNLTMVFSVSKYLSHRPIYFSCSSFKLSLILFIILTSLKKFPFHFLNAQLLSWIYVFQLSLLFLSSSLIN